MSIGYTPPLVMMGKGERRDFQVGGTVEEEKVERM